MFFTPELLAKRDSGFGLLWLAATLGSKSAFKKLPKRSVLTANITQLCDLIAEPAEPLALRLSSNLMVGVARVYKVKQEIFFSDVTTCFNSLKKVFQELHSISANDAQLQMAQPTVKPSALTLVADPRMAFDVDFDNLVADWDDYLNIGGDTKADDDDDEFKPKSKKAKMKGKPKLLLTENPRAVNHTLNENHDHLLSASFDVSLNGSGGFQPVSSQFDDGFGFDDNFFDGLDGMDVGGIGDELARELGDGWGSLSMKTQNVNTIDIGADALVDFEMAMDFATEDNFPVAIGEFGTAESQSSPVAYSARKIGKTNKQSSNKENFPPLSIMGASLTPRSVMSPTPFSQQLLAQDSEVPLAEENTVSNKRALNKTKKVRLLLDPRTELTDDELKAARNQYLEEQTLLRREIYRKKLEKESEMIVENMLSSVPTGLEAHVLVDFWLQNYKVQVEARSGLFHVDLHDEPPKKRRKIRNISVEHWDGTEQPIDPAFGNWDVDPGMEMDIDTGMDFGGIGADYNFDSDDVVGRVNSSEEPGQGRRNSSRPRSIRGSNFGTYPKAQNSLEGSQRSALFPWDNAGDPGPSSSVSGVALGPASTASDKISIDHVEIKMRESSASARSGRASSILPSRMGSIGGGPASPGALEQGFNLVGEDFVFDFPANDSVGLESQQSDLNLVNLERNSFNFLEYAKMQLQALPNPSAFLTFDDVVPKATSNSHVASAALYHCLVLGTKDIIRLNQTEAYGSITIVIK